LRLPSEISKKLFKVPNNSQLIVGRTCFSLKEDLHFTTEHLPGEPNITYHIREASVTKDKVRWDEIPAIEGLAVDWRYQPERPLGRRVWQRIADKELFYILGSKRIPVKVVTNTFQETGVLVDIAPGGMAVLLKTKLAEGQKLKVGMFLGKQTVISKGVIRNVRRLDGCHGTGIEFLDLEKDTKKYIAGMVSSKVFRNA
jgi:hypothetical protein